MENINSVRNFGIITTNKNIVDGQECQRMDKIYQKVIDIDAKVDSLRYKSFVTVVSMTSCVYLVHMQRSCVLYVCTIMDCLVTTAL